MADFTKSYKSIAGYVGDMPTSSAIFSKFKTGYPQYNSMGGNYWQGILSESVVNYFAGQFSPTWLNTVSVSSGFTPLCTLQLTGTSGALPYALVFGVDPTGAVAVWFANSVTTNIPLGLRYEQSGHVYEYTYIATYSPLQSLSSVKYDMYISGDILYIYMTSNASSWDWWAGDYWMYPSCAVRIDLTAFLGRLQYEVNHFATLGVNGLYATEFSPEYGKPSSEEGYGAGGQYGTFDDSSDIITIPTKPTLGMSSTGFVNVYKITQNALTQFGSELFPNLSFTPISSLPTPSNVTDALVNIATVLTDFGNQIPNMIDMYINNTLINYILDCHILPVNPTTTGTSNIKVGFRTFTPLVDVITTDYVDFDCGSLNIGEYYGNFIDYAPYTTAKLFLPFIGFIDVLPEFWQAGTISITYRFNIIDGSFMAYIKSTSSKSKLSDTVIAQYGGNCCIHIPITGTNYSNMITGLVGAVGGMATSGAGASSIVGGVASALNTVATRTGMQSSNSYNSSTAFLGIRTPYLLIERTVADFSSTYDTERGLPSNISTSFSKLSGFTTSSTVHLDGITGATEEELDELGALLAGGIIL